MSPLRRSRRKAWKNTGFRTPGNIEPLEPRTLLSNVTWGLFPTMLGYDQVVAQYPWLTGAGVDVASVDTGVDWNHPSLGGAIGPGYPVVLGVNFVNPGTPVMDDNGHGTGVAAILAGNPFDLNGHYQGYAPGAGIISLKQNGSDTIREALDWVIANRTTYNIQVVNITDFLDAGFTHIPYDYDAELKTLHDAGVFLCTPVGNSGPTYSIGYPASDPNVFGVGSIATDGTMGYQTQVGSALDLLAPGQNVTMAYYLVDQPVGQQEIYTPYGVGTSWASAHVAAAATLLKQIDPTASPDAIMQVMKDSGVPTLDPSHNVYYPRLSMIGAVNLAYQRFDDAYQGNSTLATAAPLAASNGAISVSNLKLLVGKPDYYSFTLGASDTVNLGVTYAGPSAFPSAELLDASGQHVADISSAGLSTSLSAGTYFVHLSSPQTLIGTYGLNITSSAPLATAPGQPASPAPANGAALTASPAALTWAAAPGAVSYDVMVDNALAGTVTSPLFTLSGALASGSHTWQVIAKNAVGSTAGATWNFTILPADGTPFGASPITIASTGSSTIEAENFNNGAESLAYHWYDSVNVFHSGYRTGGVGVYDTSAASNGHLIGWVKAGEWLKYSVNVASAGNYSLAIRTASVGPGGTFHVEVDGQNVTGALSAPDTGGWTAWQNVAGGTISLTAGQHVVKLVFDSSQQSNGFMANFDSMTLSAVVATPPPTTPPPTPPPTSNDGTPFGGTAITIANSGASTIETENFNDGGEAVAYHWNDSVNVFHSGYRTGGVGVYDTSAASNGHLIGWVKAGEWLKYSVNVASAGNYSLAIRSASVGLGGTFHVEVDGQNVTGTLSAPDTGGWAAWQNVDGGTVNLTAGQHVVKLVFDSSQQSNGYMANFDSLTFNAATATPPPPTTPPTSNDGTPFGGTAIAIPSSGAATIETENFNDGGEGIAYHWNDSVNVFHSGYRTGGVGIYDTSAASNGHLIGWVKAGEWLKYSVNVASAGNYSLAIRTASVGLGGTFHVEVDGQNVTGTLSAPDTGGWAAWQNVAGGTISLTAGQHVVKLVFDSSQQSNGYMANFDSMTFTHV